MGDGASHEDDNRIRRPGVPTVILCMGLSCAAALTWGHFNGKNAPIYLWLFNHLWAHQPMIYRSDRIALRLTSSSSYLMLLWAISITTLIAWSAAVLLRATRIAHENKERVRSLVGGRAEISATEFLALRAAGSMSSGEFTGIYVLHNTARDMFYVGQSVRVLQRISQHFTGHGNGDVYADFRNGDKFTVQTISLAESGYQSLNDLERDAITAFNAYSRGYNHTRGNRA